MSEQNQADAIANPTTKKPGGVLRIAAWIAGVAAGCLLTVALVLPLIFNVDQYRPEILRVAGHYINGKIELGKLSLSLWGRIQVRAEGLKITDAEGRSVVQVADAGFHFPFLPLFSGKPVLTLHMTHPELSVTRDKEGKLNLLKLVKLAESPVAPGEGSKTKIQSSGGSGDESTLGAESVRVPGIVSAARLGFLMEDATLVIRDEGTQASSTIDHLNFELKNASLSDTAEAAVWGDLQANVGSMVQMNGAFRIEATVTPHLAAGVLKFEGADLTMRGDFSNLELSMPGLFHKSKGVAAGFEGKITAAPTVAKVEAFDIHFFNAAVKSSGTLTLPAEGVGSPVVEYQLASNDVDFAGWSQLVPMLKEYELKGAGKFSAKISGPSDRMNYEATLSAKDLSAKAPKLKAVPVMQFSMRVLTDRVEELLFSMKAPGTDLQVKGKVLSFTTPRADFSVISSGMDFDQLLVLPPLKSGTVAVESRDKPMGNTSGQPVAESPTVPAADYDAMLEPLRAIEMARKASVFVDLNLQAIKVYDVRMTGIQGRMSLQNLVGALEKASMKVFDGTIRSDFAFDLKPRAPAYKFSVDVSGFDIQKAVDSQFGLFRNTVVGIAGFSMQGVGSSFNAEAAKKNLNSKGSFAVRDAHFATADIAKVAVDAINGAVEKVAGQIPSLKGKSIKNPSSKDTRYDSIGATFTISGGVFNMPDFVAKAHPQQGVDVKGSTELGLADGYPLKAKWEMIDTYNFTHARDLSIDEAGVRIDNLLAEGNGPVKFPVTVGCKAISPCFSYTEVPQYLGGIALGKIGKGFGKKLEGEVRQKAEAVAKDLAKKAAPKMKGALKGLKGLFKK